jgi:FimV-like protein
MSPRPFESLADYADRVEAEIFKKGPIGAASPELDDTAQMEPQPRVPVTTAPEPDLVKIAEGRIILAKNLIAIDKKSQAKEWLDLVVKMNASPETVAEAKSLLSSIAK